MSAILWPAYLVHCSVPLTTVPHYRVKLPKTFLAVNLSEAFTFEEQERMASEPELLQMKALPPKDLLFGGSDLGTETDTASTPVNETETVGESNMAPAS